MCASLLQVVRAAAAQQPSVAVSPASAAAVQPLSHLLRLSAACRAPQLPPQPSVRLVAGGCLIA